MSGLPQQTASDQHPRLEWREGTPVSVRFRDPYFSMSDGLAETRHVFLAGNGLPGRLRPGFHVAELGFGTGLNLLALAEVVPEGMAVRYTGFEASPMTGAEVRRALAGRLAGVEAVAGAMDAGVTRFRVGAVEAVLVVGDAGETLPGWDGRADAWFLDGFAPAKNPEMWGAALTGEVAAHTAPGGTFATYTAAGHVRRALAAAGFAVERVQGYGSKRHMTRGVFP